LWSYLEKKNYNPWLVMVAHACHPSYAGSINKRITVLDGLDMKCETLSQK
jgi:hypothetical protein